MKGPRVLFYVQHLLGIGHLARASRIATALADDGFAVTMVSGGVPAQGFPGPGVETIELPPVAAADQGFSDLTDLSGRPVDDAFKARRRDLLVRALHDIRPAIVIIEAYPFGRRQMRFELLPLLEAVAVMAPRPALVTSVRDILQERVKPGRNEETLDILNRQFDLVMAHGDPQFATLADTFPLASSIRAEIAYTGMVAGPRPAPSPEAYDVIVSAGGGAAGRLLVEAAVGASALVSPGKRWCLITGPNLPAADFEAAVASAPTGLDIFRFRKDFPSLLAAAQLSISQSGYNTVCDVLQAGCRAIYVPFAAGGETEQTVRAERLARLRLSVAIAEKQLTPVRLAAEIERQLGLPKPASHALDLDGARKSASILRRLVG
ncbi:glycosyltransferase [Mesorhizobium sp. BAC0120]|uniref:glycosyltransferase family protein n=1 Tax=Mesorhizobium sp. BAC0120 TaxID=3090670 RepID=UPI00298D23F0|nr:glycosyltransferase [Mesorhizobium sp. BAC0120]MDW6025602.1 glycosyltransferase [Mesorhizobium sp. BAC0120]